MDKKGKWIKDKWAEQKDLVQTSTFGSVVVWFMIFVLQNNNNNFQWKWRKTKFQGSFTQPGVTGVPCLSRRLCSLKKHMNSMKQSSLLLSAIIVVLTLELIYRDEEKSPLFWLSCTVNAKLMQKKPEPFLHKLCGTQVDHRSHFWCSLNSQSSNLQRKICPGFWNENKDLINEDLWNKLKVFCTGDTAQRWTNEENQQNNESLFHEWLTLYM